MEGRNIQQLCKLLKKVRVIIINLVVLYSYMGFNLFICCFYCVK